MNNQMEEMQRPRYEGREAEFPCSLCMPLSQHLKMLINPEALPAPSFRFFYAAFPCGSDGKESAYSGGDPGSILRLGRSLGDLATHSRILAIHSSVLAWRIAWTEEPGGLHTVHGVAKSQTRLSD